MNNEIMVNPVEEIISLHAEALRLHKQATANARRFTEIAIRAGALLKHKKTALGHGRWLPWIEENLPFTARTASRYIAAYEARDQLKSDTGMSDLTRVYQLLDTPRGPMSQDEAEHSISELQAHMTSALSAVSRFRIIRDEKAYAPGYSTFQAYLEAVGIDAEWFRTTDELLQKFTAWCQGGPALDFFNALWRHNSEMGPPPWNEEPSPTGVA